MEQTVTPVNVTHDADGTSLPDIVVNSNEKLEALPVTTTIESLDMPANAGQGEFYFSPLSSDKDIVNKNTVSTATKPTETVPNSVPAKMNSDNSNNKEQLDHPLTEEKDEAVSALLSLSNTFPSENSQDSLDNSEILPMGKKTVEAVPVQIKQGKCTIRINLWWCNNYYYSNKC